MRASFLGLVLLVAFAAPIHAQAGLVYRLDANGQPGPPTLYAYNVSTMAWATLASLPVACTTTICSDGGQIFTMGVDANVYRYVAPTNTWVVHRAGPAAASGIQPIGMLETHAGEFYWGKDGSSALWYTTGATWNSISTPAPISSGSDVDTATGIIYCRTFSELGFWSFDPTTLGFNVCAGASGVTENSRAGCFFGGNFYVRDFTGPVLEVDIGTCGVTTLAGTPITMHCATAVTAAGLIYMNSYSATTQFEVYDIGAQTPTTLPSPPAIGGNPHPSLAFVGPTVRVLSVDTVPTQVGAGQTGIAVTATVMNDSSTDSLSVTSIGLTFTGTADRTSEYIVMPGPNPTSIAAGAMAVFNFTVNVSPAATTETIVLDAQFAGTFMPTGSPVTAIGAIATDSWDVLGCAATLCGDCNGDGFVTILDALIAARHAAALITLVGNPFTNCNVIGTLEPLPGAIVDVLDALTIAQFAAGLPSPLVCC